jgi:hypothetical protein
VAADSLVAPPDQTKSYLTVVVDAQIHIQFMVYIDGVEAGNASLENVEVEPGEHKVAVLGNKNYTSHFETVHVGVGQTVQISAKLKERAYIKPLLLGLTWLIGGGIASLACGLAYDKTDPSLTDKRSTYKILTITLASIAGVGLVLTTVGFALLSSYRKKDGRLKTQYLSVHEGTPSIVPFASLVHGGGVLGLTGVF